MPKPLWSVTIPTYNAAAHLEETLRSVFAQDPGAEKMEIIVVDNRSTDNTLDLVRRVGKERVRVIVNERNVGVHGNFNRCIEVSNGELLHILHGDDIVKPGFYARFETVFVQYPDVHLACCNAELIDEIGAKIGNTADILSLSLPVDDLSEILYINPIVTPTVVVRKRAYEQVGGFDTGFSFVGDWEMWTRIVYNLKGIYLKDVLAKYRLHAKSGTSALNATGADVLDYEKIYNKFIKLGYPIRKEKAFLQLVNMSTYMYVKFYYAGNYSARDAMLALLRRHLPPWKIISLVATTAVRKNLGKIKRSLFAAKPAG